MQIGFKIIMLASFNRYILFVGSDMGNPVLLQLKGNL